MFLSEVESGKKALIKKVHENKILKQRLLDLGFIIGSEVEMVRSAPLLDPLYIKVKGYALAIRRQDAECIEVEKAKKWESKSEN